MSILSLLAQASNYDPYNYNSPSTTLTNEQAAGIAAGTVILGLVIAAVAYVVTALLLSRIFKKAGVESWKAWVPVYNSWVLLELGGQQGYWAVLALIPVVNIVAAIFMIIAMYHIGLSLGKSGAFVLLAIFLPLVWLVWLALDKSTWKGVHTAPAAQSTTPAGTGDQPTPPPVA
jgi:hypothetical protein